MSEPELAAVADVVYASVAHAIGPTPTTNQALTEALARLAEFVR